MLNQVAPANSLDALHRIQNLAYLDGQFMDDSLRSVARARQLVGIKVRGTSITDQGLSCLAGMSQLRELDISGLAISDRGLASLRQIDNLRVLDVTGCRITDAGLEVLHQLPLTRLQLAQTQVTTEVELPGLKKEVHG